MNRSYGMPEDYGDPYTAEHYMTDAENYEEARSIGIGDRQRLLEQLALDGALHEPEQTDPLDPLAAQIYNGWLEHRRRVQLAKARAAPGASAACDPNPKAS